MMFFCTSCVCVASFPPLVSLSLSFSLSLSLSLSLSVSSSLCFCEKKKQSRVNRHFKKTHISILLEHGGFHGEMTTFAALKTTTTLATMRLSRASRGRRARAFDGRFRKCAPSAAHFFFFGLDSRMRWIRGKKRAVVPSLSLGW